MNEQEYKDLIRPLTFINHLNLPEPTSYILASASYWRDPEGYVPTAYTEQVKTNKAYLQNIVCLNITDHSHFTMIYNILVWKQNQQEIPIVEAINWNNNISDSTIKLHILQLVEKNINILPLTPPTLESVIPITTALTSPGNLINIRIKRIGNNIEMFIQSDVFESLFNTFPTHTQIIESEPIEFYATNTLNYSPESGRALTWTQYTDFIPSNKINLTVLKIKGLKEGKTIKWIGIISTDRIKQYMKQFKEDCESIYSQFLQPLNISIITRLELPNANQ